MAQSRSEKKLLHDMRAGRADAYERFLDGYGGRVHGLARRYARTESDAEDLTQEIFVELCRSVGTFRGESALSTWVYRVALNRCFKYRGALRPEPMTLDDLAAQGGEPQATGAAGDPQRRVEHCELADRIDTALEALVPGQRDVVILHELHGLTYGECAAALAIPVGTVKSRLSLALGRLRTGLSQYVTSAEPTAPTADDHTTGGAGAAATTCSSAGAAPNGKAAAQ